jgi:Ca2+-binding EF-hand superfamily protein
MEEESEDDLSSDIYKSREEMIDENEKRFLQYLKAVIKSEREIEFAKRDLMRQEDFNAEDAFRLFEVKGSGVVTKNDLIFGLKLLGLVPTKNQTDIIFNKYDLDGNDFLEYEDFFDMVISYKDSDRKLEERRKPNEKVGNRKKEIFCEKTRQLYKKLFLVIIDEEERLDSLKQKLNIDDNLMREIFKKINVKRDGLCNKDEFASYCLKKKLCKEKKDAYLPFIRLNRNRDGGLESKEFSNELKSSVLGP